MSLDSAQNHLVAFADEMDRAMATARANFPPDRLRVLESSADKMRSTLERLNVQLMYFQDQYARMGRPARGPQGPGEVRQFRPRKR